MRVLLYVYEWPPLGGGVANAICELVKELTEISSLEIDIVATSPDGRYQKIQLAPQISLHLLNLGNRQDRLQSQKPSDMIHYWFRSYWFTWKLLFSGRKYDLTHTFGYPGGLVSWLFSWKWPYVISLRGVEVPGYNPKFGLYYYVYGRLSKLIWRGAKKICVNSQWLAALAQQTEPNLDYHVIPNGVDVELFKPVTETEKFKPFTVTAGATLMGSKKGLVYLIQGFAQFQQKYPQVRLLLIGSGDQEAMLRQLIKDLRLTSKVKFVGRQDKAWVAAHLPKCHVLCLPSLAEGMSNAILEAMACGLPIVTTPPSQELIRKNGFVVETNNAEAIEIALERLYQSSTLRKKSGQQSRFLAEKLTWEKTARSYYKLYKQVLKA